MRYYVSITILIYTYESFFYFILIDINIYYTHIYITYTVIHMYAIRHTLIHPYICCRCRYDSMQRQAQYLCPSSNIQQHPHIPCANNNQYQYLALRQLVRQLSFTPLLSLS